MKKYTCIFFDMDGTFIDSLKFHSKAYHRFFNKYYHPVDMDTVEKAIGPSTKCLFENLNVPDESYDELFEQLGYFYLNEADDLIREIVLSKDAKETFAQLKKSGYKTAVVTNTLKQATERILEIHGLGDCFHLVAAADQHSLDKEKRCFESMQALNAKPGEILYIGDVERDIEIANTLGFDSCFAYTEINWCEDLNYMMNVLQPTYTINALNELTGIIE